MFEPFFISTYNVIYTSMPVIFMGVLDQDVPAEVGLRYNRLYEPGIRDMFFSREKLAVSAVQGVFTTIVIVGVGLGTS